MKPLGSLLLFWIVTNAANAADSTRYVYPLDFHAFKVGTGTHIPDDPMIELSYERRIKKLGGQLRFRFSLHHAYNVDDTVSGNTYGYTLRGEGRYYAPYRLRIINMFFGPTLFFTKYKTPQTGVADQYSRTSGYDDDYVLTRSAYGIAACGGMQVRFLKHCMIEVSQGIGIQWNKSKHESRTEINKELDNTNRHDLRPGVHDVGLTQNAIVLFNVSIGYFISHK